MEEGSDFNPPNIKSLNYDAPTFPQHVIVITGQTPVGVAAHMSHDYVLFSPSKSTELGTKAFISEHPDKTQMKLQTQMS